MECGGKTRKAQAEAEIAAAATTTSKGRNTGGERQEEEEIRSFDSLPLFSPYFGWTFGAGAFRENMRRSSKH
jgi:hypothetical protein